MSLNKIALLLILMQSSLTFASDSFIAGVFSNPVNSYFSMEIEDNNYDFPVEEEFINDIIEVVSGMIYGWKFSYVPSDIKREIEEIYTLEPIAQIKIGDPKMHFRDNWVKDYIMYLNIVYQLDDFQQKRIKSWNTTTVPTSYGEGEFSMHDPDGKSLSLKEALKDSIKREFQSRGKGKIRRIEGQVLLKENPRVFINTGYFKTQAEVLLIYKEVEEYKYH